jgi:capsular polysaccharide biosynthesis protein
LPHTIEADVDPTFPPRCAVEVPPRALVRLPDARIRGQEGLVILPTGQFAGELVARNEEGCRALLHDVPAYYRPLPKRTVRRSGNYYAVLGLGVNHYYHWTHDLIMGMRGVEHLLPADTQLLVPATMKPFQTETLELLGLDGLPRVHFPAEACWELENLYVVTPRMKTNLDSREPYLWFRNAAMHRFGVPEGEPTRRLYLSRAHDGHWRTTNEPEVEALLQEHGFETVTPARLSFREQIELFAQAEVIVGTGAGLFNMVFSPPGTKILQFQDSQHIVHALWTAAGALSLEYHYFFCDSVPNPGLNADLYVPLEKLERSLHAMDIS